MSERYTAPTPIDCVTAGCDGQFRLVKADIGADDALICPKCGNRWPRNTWATLRRLARRRDER